MANFFSRYNTKSFSRPPRRTRFSKRPRSRPTMSASKSCQIATRSYRNRISPVRTSRFSFLSSFKKVAQQNSTIWPINTQNVLETSSKPVIRPINDNSSETSETSQSGPVIRPRQTDGFRREHGSRVVVGVR